MLMVNGQSLALVMVVMVAATLMFADFGVSDQCGGNISELVQQCSQFVKVTGPKIPPSPSCCAEVNKFDIPCVCKLVTAEVEKIVSMEKVVYVASTCGVKVAPGLKCGSYTVPPNWKI